MVQQIIDFLASLFANAETILHPDAVVLRRLPEIIQLDSLFLWRESSLLYPAIL